MESASAKKTAIAQSSPRRGRAHTHWFLSIFYAVAILWGVRMSIYWEPSTLDYWAGAVVTVGIGCWALLDARQRDNSIPFLCEDWFVQLGWLTGPIYLVWSRGWRGILWLVLHFIGWIVVANSMMMLAWRLMNGWR